MSIKKLIIILVILLITLFHSSEEGFAHPDCKEDSFIYLPSDAQKNEDVAGIQKELKKLGFYKGPISGIYDQATTIAVLNFQQANSLPVTGIFGADTRSKLISYYDKKTTGKIAVTPKGEISILINLDEKNLFVLADGQIFAVYPVAVGRNNASPIGEWNIAEKTPWPGGAYGTRWMALSCKWASYGIHGTNQPWSIGGAHSRGCIRMNNNDVIELYEWVKVGTPVKIIGTPYSPYYEERSQVGLGSRGSEVVLVQQKLRKLGYYKGIVDGNFKADTRKALINFQKDHGFETNGLVTVDIYPALGL